MEHAQYFKTMNLQFLKMQKLAGLITESEYKKLIKKENIDDWGNEKDDYGRSEQDYKPKPSLADFDYDEEAYEEYMKKHFPGEVLNEGMQYFHNGTEMNQIINYDDSDITDDLEALGQGSMDGQDFKQGETYNIGGNEYKIEPQGDEFKLILV